MNNNVVAFPAPKTSLVDYELIVEDRIEEIYQRSQQLVEAQLNNILDIYERTRDNPDDIIAVVLLRQQVLMINFITPDELDKLSVTGLLLLIKQNYDQYNAAQLKYWRQHQTLKIL